MGVADGGETALPGTKMKDAVGNTLIAEEMQQERLARHDTKANH